VFFATRARSGYGLDDPGPAAVIVLGLVVQRSPPSAGFTGREVTNCNIRACRSRILL